MVMPGRGITSDRQFIRGVLSCMKEFMTIDGNQGIFEKGIEPESHDVFFSKITDRRVAGSMNDFIFQVKVYLIEGQRSPFDVALLLNESPMSYLGYNRPKDQFKKLFYKDGESTAKRQGKGNVIYIDVVRPPAAKI
jgi:hypothetical protein